MPQKFELAVDLEFEDPRLEVAPDLGGERRDASVETFTFEPRALDALFEELEPSSQPPVPDGEGLVFARARTLAQQGDFERALAEVRREMAAGASRSAGLVALGDVFLAAGRGRRGARALSRGPGAAGRRARRG